jgi:hypothetical protein
MRYITAGTALNIPNDDKLADWHQFAALSTFSPAVSGVNYMGAEEAFGMDGLFDAGHFLRSQGIDVDTVLCADHPRAILDMIWNAVFLRKKKPRFSLADYILEPDEIRRIRDGLGKLRRMANPEQSALLAAWEEEERKRVSEENGV